MLFPGAAPGAGNAFHVQLPSGSSLPSDSSGIVISAAENAVVSTPATADGGRTWSFTVTAEDGVTKADYTIHVSVASAGTGGGSREDRDRFWDGVAEEIRDAAPGDVVKAEARGRGQLPWTVMEALGEADDVTLRITWNGGEDILIPSSAALSRDAGRIYYPLSDLERIDFAAAGTPAAEEASAPSGGAGEAEAPAGAEAAPAPSEEPEGPAPQESSPEPSSPAGTEPAPEDEEGAGEAASAPAAEPAPEEGGGAGLWIAAAAAAAAALAGLLWRRKGKTR